VVHLDLAHKGVERHMGMDMGMEFLRDSHKGMGLHLDQDRDRDRDRDASIESCPALLGIDEMGRNA